MTRCASRPRINSRAKAMTSAGSGATERVPITSADSGSARSTTGASVVLNPKARTARAISAPNSRAMAGLLARGSAHRLRRRQGRESIAQPVDGAAFHIDVAHAVAGAKAGGFIQQRSRLFGILDVAAEKDDARRSQQAQPGALQRSQSAPESPTTSRLPTARRRFRDVGICHVSIPYSLSFQLPVSVLRADSALARG